MGTVTINPNDFGGIVVTPDNPHDSYFGIGGKLGLGPVTFGGRATTNDGFSVNGGTAGRAKTDLGDFGKYSYNPFSSTFTAQHPSGAYISFNITDESVTIGYSKSIGLFRAVSSLKCNRLV